MNRLSHADLGPVRQISGMTGRKSTEAIFYFETE